MADRRLLLTSTVVVVALAIAGDHRANAEGTLGEPCGPNFSCTQENTACRFGFCECPYGYFEDVENVRCVKGSFFGESCGDEVYCWERNSACIDGVCGCPSGFSRERDQCIPQIKELGEACSYHAQCITPYAQCTDGVCACAKGLESASGKCAIKSARCIREDAPLTNGLPIRCSLQLDGSHDCPDDMECIPSDQPMVMMEGISIAGICCPASAFEKKGSGSFQCAVGEQVPVDRCYDESWETHFLIVHDATGETICCPRACTHGRIYDKDHCYDAWLQTDEQCTKSFQCFPGAECQGNKCKCIKGHKLISGYCYDESCPVASALTDSANKTVSCVNSPCPKNYFCVQEFDLCCPLVES